MKKYHLLRKLLFLFIFILALTSCKDIFKDDDDPQPKDEYLVSYELEKSYLPVFIESLFDELVDEYPELSAIQDKVKYGVMIYSIKYNTTFKGENVVASGLVCVPIGEGPFPVMSYQNGTNTLHSQAPSVNPDRDLYLMLEFAASTGFIISIPDYLGFGASSNMFHPYLHEESTVQSVLDMLRAVDELTANWLETNSNDQLYLTGYSQGGWATMQVQKAIEEQYTDEFNLIASSPSAGPYDLTLVNDYILNQIEYPMPFFIGYVINSYLNLGLISVAPGKIFQEPYASKVTTIYDGTKSGDEINSELTTTVADLFTQDYLGNYKTDDTYASVISALENNSIEAWNASTPMMLIHGAADELVPMQVTSNIYQDFLDKGVNESDITFIPLAGKGHAAGIIPAGLASIQWFLDLQEQN